MRLSLGCALVLTALTLTACDHAPTGTVHDAIRTGDAVALAAHLDAGADVNGANELGVTPLVVAVTTGQSDAVRALLAAGADVNLQSPSGQRPLIAAVTSDHADAPVIMRLLTGAADIDLDARDAREATALGEAVAFMNPIAVIHLLDCGADPNAPGPHGRTALHFAAIAHDGAMTDRLLRAGADPDRPDDDGMRALHWFVHMADDPTADVMTLLLDRTTDLDARNGSGATALHVAVQSGSAPHIKALLDAGADPLAFNLAGHSPVCYAATDSSSGRHPYAVFRATVALFRAAGLDDETPIDTNGGTLAEFEARLIASP